MARGGLEYVLLSLLVGGAVVLDVSDPRSATTAIRSLSPLPVQVVRQYKVQYRVFQIEASTRAESAVVRVRVPVIQRLIVRGRKTAS
jgi:hypothetical protein